MERYLEKIANCMENIRVQVDDETYAAVEGLRVIYAIVEGQECFIADGACAFQFEGKIYGGNFGVKICEMNHINCATLSRHFQYLNPIIREKGNWHKQILTHQDKWKLCQAAETLSISKDQDFCFRLKAMVGSPEWEIQKDALIWSLFRQGYKKNIYIISEVSKIEVK